MRFLNAKRAVSLAALVAIPVITNGCGEDGLSNPADSLCCKDFQVGADLTGVDLGGNVEFNAFAQAVSDFSAVADATLGDVLASCRAIALDLGADANDPALNGKSGGAAVKAWCDLATAKIDARMTASASGAITIKAVFDPPRCSASFEAKASCEGKCDVNAKCDLKANPPKCTGGELSVTCEGSCSGSCEGSASASVSCQGECSAVCEGSCEAQGGVSVDCDGQCEGTCQGDCTVNGSTQTGTNGACAGQCKGKCSAKCTARAGAQVKCNGKCAGKCQGSCKAAAGANVKCEGSCKGGCSGDVKAPKCEGGKLEGGCTASADCQASCNASASARAECTPPKVSIAVTGQVKAEAQAQFNVLVHTLEVNLPRLLVAAKARVKTLGEVGGSVTASANGFISNPKLSAKGVVCAGAVLGAVTSAAANVKASGEATVSILGKVGG